MDVSERMKDKNRWKFLKWKKKVYTTNFERAFYNLLNLSPLTYWGLNQDDLAHRFLMEFKKDTPSANGSQNLCNI